MLRDGWGEGSRMDSTAGPARRSNGIAVAAVRHFFRDGRSRREDVFFEAMHAIMAATRNRHKAREFSDMLGGICPCISLADFPDAPIPIEDGATFAENASKKSAALAGWMARQPSEPLRQRLSIPRGIPIRLIVLADDSGLEVDALDGAPGVRSARFAAPDAASPHNSSDEANNRKLLDCLQGRPWDQRAARFRCVLAASTIAPPLDPPPAKAPPDPLVHTRHFEGVCPGHISLKPAGTAGFGYDPLFIPDGFDLSFAEMGESVKNSISHRARAIAEFRAWLQSEGDAAMRSL